MGDTAKKNQVEEAEEDEERETLRERAQGRCSLLTPGKGLSIADAPRIQG